ncbi:hypothetical protein ABIE49_005862 [Bradyrhizobium sp. OAE829]
MKYLLRLRTSDTDQKLCYDRETAVLLRCD